VLNQTELGQVAQTTSAFGRRLSSNAANVGLNGALAGGLGSSGARMSISGGLCVTNSNGGGAGSSGCKSGSGVGSSGADGTGSECPVSTWRCGAGVSSSAIDGVSPNNASAASISSSNDLSVTRTLLLPDILTAGL